MTWTVREGACRVCGCTDNFACVDEGGRPCHWVIPGELCSACDLGKDSEPIGQLTPIPGPMGNYRATCTSCTWTRTDARAQAEASLRLHVDLTHPEPIPIYRKPSTSHPPHPEESHAHHDTRGSAARTDQPAPEQPAP